MEPPGDQFIRWLAVGRIDRAPVNDLKIFQLVESSTPDYRSVDHVELPRT